MEKQVESKELEMQPARLELWKWVASIQGAAFLFSVNAAISNPETPGLIALKLAAIMFGLGAHAAFLKWMAERVKYRSPAYLVFASQAFFSLGSLLLGIATLAVT